MASRSESALHGKEAGNAAEIAEPLIGTVADEAPINLRATSFGVFNFVSGIALLLASLIAGALWETVGPYATFTAGAVLTAVGLVGTAVALGRGV